VAGNTIAKLERGEHEPAWPLVLALADALGVDCTAFRQAPTQEQPATRRGRPRKPSEVEPTAGQSEAAAEPAPTKARSRKPAADQVEAQEGKAKGKGRKKGEGS
jgi:hypothetical protein